jgi:predicted phage terminase large subunit-like protein
MSENFRLQSWDFGCSAAKRADYSVGSSWEFRFSPDNTGQSGAYLCDLWRGRLEFTALKKQVVAWAEAFKPEVILLENKVSGMAMLQELRATTHLPVVGVTPVTDKMTRLLSVISWFEAGRVFFPRTSAWLGELEAELLAFPHGAHDDQVDSLVQALCWLKEKERGAKAGIRKV